MSTKLTLSHDAGEWSYGDFNKFRLVIARLLGYTIKEQNFYVPDFPPDQAEQRLKGTWRTCAPVDPIDVLMYHSDSEGVIKYKHLLALASRLRDIQMSYRNLRHYRNKDAGFLEQLERLDKGIRDAYVLGEDLRFT